MGARTLRSYVEQPLIDAQEINRPLEDIAALIKSAIVDEPPLAQKDGGIIREGYHEDVDKFRRSRTDGKKWLTLLAARVPLWWK